MMATIARIGLVFSKWQSETRAILHKIGTKTFASMPGQKVKVNNISLHYEKVGNGDHVVLLLPGALGTTRSDFDPQMEKMNRDKFTLIAWDPPGYGFSRPPDREYTVDFLHRDADLAAAFMKTLKFNKYSLIGWSDGGVTSLIMAGKYKDAVQKMVIFGAQAFVTKTDVELMTAIQNLDKWSQRMKDPLIATYGKECVRKMWYDEVECFKKVYENGGDICVELIPNIKCPTFILHGRKDPLVPEEHANYLHKKIAGSKLHVFPEGKHNIHLRYPDEFNKLVETFLCN